jgi:hypothetical protein
MTMSANVLRPLIVIAFACAASACSWFGKNEMRESYLDADPGKSLQVPPDLDSPARRESMRVPEVGGTAGNVSEAPVGGLPVDADDPQSRLKLRMAPDEAFDAVVAALTQAQIATIGEVDREARKVELGFDVTEEKKRWWWKDGTRTSTIRRYAHVIEDPIGSRVVVEEGDDGLRIDDEYAQRMLSALRDRISWE